MEAPLGETWRAGLLQGFVLANESPHFSAYFAEGSVVRGKRPWLDLGGGYREQLEQRDNHWLEESRLFALATLKWTWRDCACSDRNQVEWREMQERTDQVRYRNKLAVDLPARWSVGPLRPYVADELFYDQESKEFLRNRIYVGLKGAPDPRLKLDLFAIWESSDTGVNERETVLITGLKLVVPL